jgi:fructose-1,6-bisphosphatase/inositol monophosphatase family enzyme
MIVSVSWTYLKEPLRGQVAARLARFAGVVGFRCSAHEYRLSASGHCHAQLYNKLMPWDHLPGWLIHREAGGHAARFDGSAYGPLHRDGGLIVTPDRESWETVRHTLLDP